MDVTGNRAAQLGDVVIAGVTAVALVLIAIDGGSFDLVIRQGWSTFLWWAVALGTLAGLLFRSRPHALGTIPIVALIGLTVWTALSLRWTMHDELTVIELARVVTYLGVVVMVFAAVPARRWHAVVAGAAVGAVAICAWAMAHRLWPDRFDDIVSIFAGDNRRLSAPFGYWNAVGAWAGMTSALCLGWAAHARSIGWRAAAAMAIPLAVTVSYLTYSRAAIGGTAVGLLVLLAVSRNRLTLLAVAVAAAVGGAGVIALVRGRPEIADAAGGAGGGAVLAGLAGAALLTALVAALVARVGADRVRLSRRVARVVIPIGLVLGVIAVGVAGATVGPDLWDQFRTLEKASDGSDDAAARLTDLNGARYEHWEVAWESFQEAPWKGSGPGTFEYAWNQDHAGFVRDAHSLYFEALAEMGIPGLALLLLLIVGVGLAAWRAIAALVDPAYRGVIAGALGAIAAFLFGAGVDWLWESPAVAVLAFVLIGALIAATARPAGPPRWPIRIAIALAAIVMTAIQLPGLVSTSEVRKSQDALRAGDVVTAREHADTAIDAQPWAASPLTQRALVDERARAYEVAAAELRAAALKAPYDWRIPLLLARVEARAGNAEEALAALRRAKRLRPNSQFFAQR